MGTYLLPIHRRVGRPKRVIWLDPNADDGIVLNVGNGRVATMNDQSGNGNHFSQTVAANQVSYIAPGGTGSINGKASLQVTAATQQWLSGPSLSFLSASETFLILKPGSGAGQYARMFIAGAFGNLEVDCDTTGAVQSGWGSVGRYSPGGTFMSRGVAHILNYVSTPSRYAIYVDGAVMYDNTTSVSGVAFNTYGTVLGATNASTANATPAYYSDAIFGEWSVYGNELSVAQRNDETSRLRLIWGTP